MAKPMIEPMMEILDIPMTPASTNSEATSPEIKSEISGVYLPLHDMPLSPRTREALYNRLKGDLGPSHGFQESVGTYQAFMNQKARLYLDRLFRSPRQDCQNYVTTFQTVDQEEAFSSSPADTSPITREGADFRKWMLFGYAKRFHNEDTTLSLVPDGYPPGLDVTPPELGASISHSTSLVTDNGQLTPLGSLPSDEHLQSIEDLFPTSPTQPENYGVSRLTGSPVLRTENVDVPSNDENKDTHLNEKQIANSSLQNTTKQRISRLSTFHERNPLASPSYQHLQRGSPPTLPALPGIKDDVFHEQPAALRRDLHGQQSNACNSTIEIPPPRSRSGTSAFSRSQAIRVMFENERTNTRSSTARLRRTRTSSAGGGI
jgi:hypothetical protein